MARIVLGIGTSHGPLLTTPPDKWSGRVEADRQNPAHAFRGGTYTFDQLVELRAGEDLGAQITIEARRARFDACQTALDALAATYRETAPDVAVVVGNDQMEMFTEENVPAIAVYWGETIENVPFSEEQKKLLPPGVALAEMGHHPPEPAVYPGEPGLGRHLIGELMADGFDIAASNRIPEGSPRSSGVAHAFGFVYRRIMADEVTPNVPVILNTFYPPNQPPARRCRDLGVALARAIRSWDSDKTVAVCASGGLSHFVVDEDLDRTVLEAMQAGDFERLTAIPENLFQSGSSEIKNWIPVASAMAEAGLAMELLDYVPCYRSEAGTGNAMAFACWR